MSSFALNLDSLKLRADWAGLVRYWMAHHRLPQALEYAIAIIDGLEDAALSGRDELQGVLRKLPQHEFPLPEEVPEEFRATWRHEERMTYDLIPPFLLSSFVWVEGVVPEEQRLAVLERIAQAAADGARQAALLSDLPLVARFQDFAGTTLHRAGDPERAGVATRAALDLYRQLALADPETYEDEFARALSNLGGVLAEQGHLEHAVATLLEALELRGRIAVETPQAPITTLGNLVAAVAQLDDHALADSALNQALAIFQRLAGDHPQHYAFQVADLLGLIGLNLIEHGQEEAAMPQIQQAIADLRPLAATGVAAAGEKLAKLLRVLANIHVSRKSLDEALALIDELVELRRGQDDAGRGAAQVANALTIYSALQVERGDWNAAKEAQEEVVALLTTSADFSASRQEAMKRLAYINSRRLSSQGNDAIPSAVSLSQGRPDDRFQTLLRLGCVRCGTAFDAHVTFVVDTRLTPWFIRDIKESRFNNVGCPQCLDFAALDLPFIVNSQEQRRAVVFFPNGGGEAGPDAESDLVSRLLSIDGVTPPETVEIGSDSEMLWGIIGLPDAAPPEWVAEVGRAVARGDEPAAHALMESYRSQVTASFVLGLSQHAADAQHATLYLADTLGSDWLRGLCLQNFGARMIETDRPQEAIGVLEEAVPLLVAGGDRWGEAFCLSRMGLAFEDLGDFSHAGELFEASASIFEEIGDLYLELLQRYSAANMLTNRELHAEAIEANTRVLAMSMAQRRPAIEVQCHARIGRGLLDLGRFTEALPYLEDAIRMDSERESRASLLLDLGQALDGLDRDEEAEHRFVEAQQLFRELGDAAGLASSAARLSGLHVKHQRIDEALVCHEAMANVLEPIDPKMSLLEIYKMGEIASAAGRREDGVQHFLTALAGLEELHDDDAVGATLFNIGSIRLAEQRWSDALELFEQSIARLAVQPLKQASPIMGSIRCLWELDRRDEAESRLSAAIETYRAAGASHILATAIAERAEFAAARGDTDEAQAQLETAFELLEGSPLAQAAVLKSAAEIHETLGREKERIDALERAFSLLRDYGPPSAALVVGMELGVAQDAQGNVRAARRTLDWVAKEIGAARATSVQRIGGDLMLATRMPEIGRLRFDLFMKLALIYTKLEDYAAALAVAHMGLDPACAPDDARLLAGLLALTASLEARTDGSLEAALEAAEKALDLGRETGDEETIALALSCRSEVLKDLGRYAEALECARESLALSEDRSDSTLAVEALLRLGYIYRGLGRSTDAQSSVEKSLALARSRGEDDESVALAMIALASVAIDQGRLQDALSRLREAEEVANSIGASGILASVHANRAGLYYHLGDVERGLESGRRALDFARRSHNRPFLANVHGDLGLLYWSKGELDTARAEMLTALEIEKAMRHPRGMALSLSNLGGLAMATDTSAAIGLFRDAVDVASSAGFRSGEARARGNLGAALASTGRYLEAYDELSVAQAIAAEGHDWPLLPPILHHRSVAAEHLGLEDEAWRDCVEAYDRIKKLRLDIDISEYRIAFAGPSYAALAERFVAMNLRRGRLFEAWQAIEHSRSRVLAEQLGNQDWPRPVHVREEDWRSEQDLHRRMRAADVALNRAIDARARGALEREIETVRDALQNVWASMEAVAPDYVAVRRGDDVSPAELIAPFAPTGAVRSIGFLEFFELEDRVHVLIYRSGWELPKTFPTDVRSDSFLIASNSFEADLLGQTASPTIAASGPEAAEALGSMLFGQALAELGEVDVLYLAPCPTLDRVPLHVLPVDGAPLIQLAPVAYIPSATILGRLQQGHRGALALGESLVIGFAEKPQDRAIFVGEAEEVAVALGVQVITDDLATSAVLRNSTIRRPVIHLSCHGHFDPQVPLNSGLDLADGRLTVHGIMELSFSADLVTLSACETGISRRLSGDEGIGIPRALLLAGATAALVSLWSVEAKATRRMMGRFYAARVSAQGDSLYASATALRQACLELRADPAYAHPYFWAPFQLLGAAHEAEFSSSP